MWWERTPGGLWTHMALVLWFCVYFHAYFEHHNFAGSPDSMAVTAERETGANTGEGGTREKGVREGRTSL